MGGGYQSGGPTQSVVDKFAFSDDSRSALSSGLSSARSYTGAAANSGTAGYYAGASGYEDTVDKFAFPGDSRTTLGTGLASGTGYLAGMANEG